MQNSRSKNLLIGIFAALLLTVTGLAKNATRPKQIEPARVGDRQASHRAPLLGADLSFASTPSTLIEAWLDKEKGDALAIALNRAGVSSLRLPFGGLYSPQGAEETARIKAENKTTNQYSWFPLDAYVDFIAAHELTTIVGINVEEGPGVARKSVEKFIDRGLKSRIVAIELSNEPWLNYRPWLPEEFAARAADIIEGLAPMGLPFALPLTVGSDNNTPTKLSDNEWVTRMLRTLSARIDLKQRADIFGVLHLYSKGVRAESVDAFNKVVKPFAPGMRYLVTEFNIRLGLEGNPHLTNKYAMEFARKLSAVMSRSEIEAMYTHAVPFHSILYWSNGRRYATVVGGRDEKLTGDAMSRGWHLTPTGKVYDLYSRLAWKGEVVFYREGGKQPYWAIRTSAGGVIVSLVNDGQKAAKKKANIAGRDLMLSAPAHSIVCFDGSGKEIERLVLAY